MPTSTNSTMPPTTRNSSNNSTAAAATITTSTSTSKTIKDLIKKHSLEPHPEGGYFAETYRSSTQITTPSGQRSSSTAIKFLITKEAVSRLHRIKSDECWHFYEGGPMTVIELDFTVPSHVRKTTLGNGKNDVIQYIVKAGTWFGAVPKEGTEFSLVGCTVSPGFDFADFEMATPNRLRKEFVKAGKVIDEMTIGLLDSGSVDDGNVDGDGDGDGDNDHHDNDNADRSRRDSLNSEYNNDNETESDTTKNKDKNKTLQYVPKFRNSDTEKPRQILTSLVLFISIIYMGYNNKPADGEDFIDPQHAFRNALLAAFLAFEVFVFLQVRDLLTVFPHPGFWRLVFGAGAFYGLILVAMLSLDHTKARWIFEAIFQDLGTMAQFTEDVTLSKETTMASCKVTPLAVFKQIFFAPWFISHAIGWAGKMLIFRDWGVCLLAALFFEFTELTFTYVVPEFEECWWDSIFLDTLGANLLGMWMGWHINKWIARYIKSSKSSESAIRAIRGGNAAIVGAPLDWAGQESRQGDDRVVSLISPWPSGYYSWKIFSSPLRLFQVMILIFVMLFVEINTFLMMNTIGIPHGSIFNKLRLALMGFMSLPAAAEWYVYIEHSQRANADVARIGPACWLTMCLALLEFSIFFKFFPMHFVSSLVKLGGYFPMPWDILRMHVLSWTLFGTWFLLRYYVVGSKIYDDNTVTQYDREIVSKLVMENFKETDVGGESVVREGIGARANSGSLFQKLPDAIKKRIVYIELVDILLYVSLLPLFALCKYWKF